MEVEGIQRFQPRGITQRIGRQGGLFTIHGPPDLPLDDRLSKHAKLEKIIAKASYRRELLFELSHYGVNKATLSLILMPCRHTRIGTWQTETTGFIKSQRSFWQPRIEVICLEERAGEHPL